jgi:hypothetical protein
MLLEKIFIKVLKMEKYLKLKYVNYTIIFLLSSISLLMLTSFLNRITNPPVDAEIDDAIFKFRAEEVIQVNVLNACGENGLAAKTEMYLRDVGFDVVEIGNYDVKLNNSIIIDRVGDKKSAEKVAYALGINEDNIITKIDSTHYLRASVILGNDFSELKHLN